MKTKVVVALTMFMGTFLFAQKSELKTAEKAIKSGNYADAKTALATAESMIESDDAKMKTWYHFLKGQAFYANGTGSNEDIDAAIENFDMAVKVEDQSGKKKYTDDIKDMKAEMLNSFLTKANSALQSKDYIKSSMGFDRAYRMSPKDTLYLYYAASTAVTAKDYETSLKFYEELRDLGFKGIGTEFYAVNKESGVKEKFDNKSLRDISVKTGTHIKPTDEKTESKSGEIVKNIALIHISNGDDEKALAAMDDARKENPKDLGLLISEANIQLKMGNKERFKELMEEATKKDPNNAELQYNLGVISADAGEKEAAKAYYERAIELDPSYANAYTNMSVLILSNENEIVEEMNSLGTSTADNKRYDELKGKRIELYESAIPYLEKALKLKPDSLQAAQTLMNIYSVVGKTDKFKAMKSKIAEMQGGQ
ncbi:MAG: tetratricopeptide repeat protein [Bacteroidota bacterium]